ncbi:hypothetical protein BT69DRAFT_35144 [Atractiella rhizophila]|nr:hypothetical protein BT69DRAFT_35144 [Atractiella rhizophila]
MTEGRHTICLTIKPLKNHPILLPIPHPAFLPLFESSSFLKGTLEWRITKGVMYPKVAREKREADCSKVTVVEVRAGGGEKRWMARARRERRRGGKCGDDEAGECRMREVADDKTEQRRRKTIVPLLLPVQKVQNATPTIHRYGSTTTTRWSVTAWRKQKSIVLVQRRTKRSLLLLLQINIPLSFAATLLFESKGDVSSCPLSCGSRCASWLRLEGGVGMAS